MINPMYWISVEPPSTDGVTGYVYFGVIAAFILAAIVFRVLRGRVKDNRARAELFRHLGRLLMSMGVIGLVLYFFSYENLRFLGGRFWYLLWALATLLWAGWIVWHATRTLPAMNTVAREQSEREKYLPKPKK
jgi:hypothetical protein